MLEKPLKHITFAAFIGILPLVFLWFTYMQTPPQAESPKHPSVSQKWATRKRLQSRETRKQDTLKNFQQSEFYRTIIDKNLFRPLDWTPSRQKESYRLLGTLIPTDKNAPPQAILQSTATRTTHIVRIYDTLDTNTTITDIQPK